MIVLLLEAFPVVPMPSHFRVGLHLVCAILVAWLLVDAWAAVRARRWLGLLAPALLLLLSVPPSAFYFEQLIGDIRLHAPTFYLTRDEQAALSWLETAGVAPNPTVVLADSPAFNLYIAPYTGARPVRGHNAMTMRVREKDGAVRRFFDPDTPQEERRHRHRRASGHDACRRDCGATHRAPDAGRGVVARLSTRGYQHLRGRGHATG